MKKIFLMSLVVISLILTLPAWAYNPMQVSEWTEQTLMTTLTAGHHERVSEAANVHRQFKIQAWRSMDGFFKRHIDIFRTQYIKFQPEPIAPAVLVAPEDCDEASCWWVHQAFLIPELGKRLDFTALVATADPAHASPLIIHKLTIVVSSYVQQPKHMSPHVIIAP